MKMKQLTMLVMAACLPFIGFAKSSLTTLVLPNGETLEPDSSLTFTVDLDLDTIGGYEVLSEFSPDGVEVVWTGKKFTTPKAGSVKYKKSEEGFVDTKDSENPCAVKINISKKTGKVTGSFKLYVAKSEKKLKTYTAKISGYVGSGSLTVTIKKVGTFTASLD